MRLIIIAGFFLLAGFIALMALGGDSNPRPSDEQQAAEFSPGEGMRLLGVITAPFAPRVKLHPTSFALGADPTAISVPGQSSDRQTLRLELTAGKAATAVLTCAEQDVCGKPLCLSLDGVRLSLCDNRSPVRADGSLIVPRAGGTLTLRAVGASATVMVR